MKNILFLILITIPIITFSNDTNYIFGWTHLEDSNLKTPRGGTTNGPEVNLDTRASDFWIQLQNPNLIV